MDEYCAVYIDFDKILETPHGPSSVVCIENYGEDDESAWQKDKDGEYLNKPIDAFNHYLDALRYSLQCQAKKMRTMDKSVLSIR